MEIFLAGVHSVDLQPPVTEGGVRELGSVGGYPVSVALDRGAGSALLDVYLGTVV